MRPEAELKLRQGFQRRADEQRDKYAAQLADARQFAASQECGEVVGVFTTRAGGGVRPRARFGLSIWRGREPRRNIWLYAFTEAFALFDRPQASAVTVRWSQVTEVGVIWTETYDPGAEESRPVVSGYSLRCADGQVHEIARSFQNVRDPYGEFGRSLRRLLPAAVGETMPRFPTIDEVIATYAPRPGQQGLRATTP